MLYSIIRSISKSFKVGMYDYCQLEAPDLVKGESESTRLVCKDGSIVSVFEILGSFVFSGKDQFRNDLNDLIGRLEGVLKKEGYQLEFVFLRDPESGYESIRKSIESSMETARRIGLDAEAIINSKKDVLSDKVALEKCFLVVKTMPTVLTGAASKEAIKKRTAKATKAKSGLKPGEFSQSALMLIQELRDYHIALLKSISNSMGHMIKIELLNSHSAIKSITDCMGSNSKHHDWKPKLLGDKIQPRTIKESMNDLDISHLLPLDIGMQIFDKQPEQYEKDNTIVRYGSNFYAPLSVDIPPLKNERLNNFVNDIDQDVPYMINFKITSGHKSAKSKVSTKGSWATFLAFSSSENSLIKQAADELLYEAESRTLVIGTISACTWGDSPESISKRKSILTQALQGWGAPEVIEEAGDPIQAWCNTLPGFTGQTLANRYPISLNDVFKMLPLERPVSPWKTGPMLYRTLDNKAYPYWPSSSKQTASSSIYYAPPGFGKSFKLAASNMSLITSPGLSELPYLTILDIGYSSSSFVALVKSMLPEDKKHQALSIKYEMSPEYAFNCFDTPLGCRKPLSVDRAFISNFLSLVLTPASADEEIPRLSELIGTLIDAMYEYYSDNNSPHSYERGICEQVDEALDRLDYYPDGGTSWWDVVDYLYANNKVRVAISAQRYAVPTLNDATTVLSSDPGIQELYSEAKYNGESLLKFITNMIISSVREFPSISIPTAFDLGDARIVAIDLSSVAQSGSRLANKQTAIMYMLTRQMTCKDFYRDKTLVTQIPDKYKKYHLNRFTKIAASPKKLCMDEFHRTSHSIAVRNQVKIDLREARKFGLTIDLLSQLLDDFDDDTIKLVNNIYVLSRGNSEEDLNQIKEKFKPSKDAMSATRRYLTGPSSEGSTILYFATLKGEKQARAEMIIRLTLGANEIWAYSTTPKDVRLRTLLSEKVGLTRALTLLGKHFPSGSAEDYLQNKITENPDTSIDDLYKTTVIELSNK